MRFLFKIKIDHILRFSNMRMDTFIPITTSPTEDCDIIVISEDGLVTNAKYIYHENRYELRDKTITPAFWCYNSLSENTIISSKDSMRLISVDDPETELPLFSMSGLCLRYGWNFEEIKNIDDMTRVADSIGQMFFEKMVNDLRNTPTGG